MEREMYGEQSYTEHFRAGGSGEVIDGVLLNAESRLRKARKMLAVLSDFIPRPLDELDCLDIGCSGGHITRELGLRFKSTVGIDTDSPALDITRAYETSTLRFQHGSATAMPFDKESFDVVVCNHVYEHVNDQQAMFDEIGRVLRPGGVCYLGAGNRFAPIEPHYRLPLLSWPPKPLANAYMRLARRRGPYMERHLSYWGLQRLLRRFKIVDYTPRVLAEPARFSGGDPAYAHLPTRFVPERLLLAATPFAPTWIWLLVKE